MGGLVEIAKKGGDVIPLGRAGPGLSEYLRTSGFSTLLFILITRLVENAKRKDLVGLFSLLRLLFFSLFHGLNIPDCRTVCTEPFKCRFWCRKGVVAATIWTINLVHDSPLVVLII